MSRSLVSTARSYDLTCGSMPVGPANRITDIAGVTIGHFTLNDGSCRTGFTVVLPHQQNLFREKLPAAVEVINGFGKSAGLVQAAELGTLESPILLTNTFAVGTGLNALIRKALDENPEIGRSTGTVNPVVMECNDGYLNNIQAMVLTEAQAAEAIATASPEFCQGSVGAGTGMSAFGFKGGIGSASRTFELNNRVFTLGSLVLANFGRPGELILPDGRMPIPDDTNRIEEEHGSVIIILATDVPLESRQLKRVARRAGAGLARLGSHYGNGSGDIALAFSTARRIMHFEKSDIIACDIIREDAIDPLFKAAAETTQEAVLNAMIAAPSMRGHQGNSRPSLADWLESQDQSAR